MLEKQKEAMRKGRQRRARKDRADKLRKERYAILHIEFTRDRALFENYQMIFVKKPIPRAKIIEDNEIKLGMSLFFQYLDIEDRCMQSSRVKEVKYSVDRSGIVVYTENSVYTFSEVGE